jgi:hypothetical protein
MSARALITLLVSSQAVDNLESENPAVVVINSERSGPSLRRELGLLQRICPPVTCLVHPRTN